MFELPNYDTQFFEDIVAGAVKKIRSIYPKWTDYNAHDPGITLIDLFAWLKEMEQYYLNRITPEGISSLAKLLGHRFQKLKPPECYVLLNTKRERSFLLGEGLKAENGVCFEFSESCTTGAVKLKGLILRSGEKTSLITENVMHEFKSLYPFGITEEEYSCFYIGMEQPAAQTFHIYFELGDTHQIKRNPFSKDSDPPRALRWYCSAGDEEAFIPIEVTRDETKSLAVSGNIYFNLPPSFKEQSLYGVKGFWIQCVLAQKGCEESPQITGLYGTVLKLIQQETLCRNWEMRCRHPEQFMSFSVEYFMERKDRVFVLYRSLEGWRLNKEFELQRREDGAFSIGFMPPQDILCDEFANIMVILAKKGVIPKIPLDLMGFPCGVYANFMADYRIIPHLIALLVKNEKGCYEKWRYTDSLEKAGAYDKCFTYNAASGQLLFGDNEFGETPLRSDNEILVTACILTEGKAALQDSLAAQWLEGESKSYKYIYTRQGANAETMQETLIALRRELQINKRAVSLEDYEQAAIETPGRRVLCAKAFMGMGENDISIAVLPYSNRHYQMPDESFLRDVFRQVQRYRLITAKVNVISAVLAPIDIFCSIQINLPQETVQKNIALLLSRMFEIRSQEQAHIIGAPVVESQVGMAVASAEGVSRVHKVSLGAQSHLAVKDSSGNLVLPEYGIPVLGHMEFSIQRG